MSPVELRDELMTLLVAGHETTASELAWAFERLTRTPDVLGRLTDEIDSDGDDAYLTATVQETLRRRPVLPNAAPRLVMQPVEIGGWRYEPGVCLIADAYLLHHDPDVYPDPYAFRPERFLDQQPGTYTWIPFGGGRRRCLGASFAQLEMKIVLRAVLAQHELAPAAPGDEGTRRRSITLSPKAGSRAVLRARRPGARSGGCVVETRRAVTSRGCSPDPSPSSESLRAAIPDRPFAVRFWDGRTLPATNGAGPTFEVRSPDAFAHVLLSPGQLGLGRAYVSGRARGGRPRQRARGHGELAAAAA